MLDVLENPIRCGPPSSSHPPPSASPTPLALPVVFQSSCSRHWTESIRTVANEAAGMAALPTRSTSSTRDAGKSSGHKRVEALSSSSSSGAGAFVNATGKPLSGDTAERSCEGSGFNPKARLSTNPSQSCSNKLARSGRGGPTYSRSSAAEQTNGSTRSTSLAFDVRLTELLADCDDGSDATTQKAGCILALFDELMGSPVSAETGRGAATMPSPFGTALTSLMKVALPCLHEAMYSPEQSESVTADGFITRKPWKVCYNELLEEFETVRSLLSERDQYIAHIKSAAGELTVSEREEKVARINRLEFECAKAKLDREAAEAKLVASTQSYNENVKRLSSEVSRLRHELQVSTETSSKATSHLVGDAAKHIHDVFSKPDEPEQQSSSSSSSLTLEEVYKSHDRLEKQLLGLQNVRLAEYEEALNKSNAPSEFPILRESFANDMMALEEEILALNRHKESVINSSTAASGGPGASGTSTHSVVNTNMIAQVTGQVGVNIVFEGPGLINGKTARWFKFGSEIDVPATTVRMTPSLEYQPVPPVNILLARANSTMRESSGSLRPGSLVRRTTGRRSTAATGHTAAELKDELKESILSKSSKKNGDDDVAGERGGNSGSAGAADAGKSSVKAANKANSLHTGHVIECIKRDVGLSVNEKIRLPRSISEESLIEIIERVYSGKVKSENDAVAAAFALQQAMASSSTTGREDDAPASHRAGQLAADVATAHASAAAAGSGGGFDAAQVAPPTAVAAKESLLMFFSRYLQERYVLPTIVVHVATDILFAADQYRDDNSVIALFAGTLVGEKDEAVWRYSIQWTRVLSRMEHRTIDDVYAFLTHFYPSAREDELQGLLREYVKQNGDAEVTARKVVHFLTGCLLKRNEPKLRKWRKVLRWKDTHHTSTMTRNDFVTIASKFFKGMTHEALMHAYDMSTSKMSPTRVNIETLAFCFCYLDALQL